MTTNLNKTLQISLVAVFALFVLMGCGASTTAHEGFGSNDLSSTDPSADLAQAAMAICSQDVAGHSDFQVRLMQYTDPQGQTRSDLVRLQFKLAPLSWKTDNLDLMIYRWTAAADNSVSLDSTPLTYQFERKSGASFQLISSNSYPIFNWEEIQQMGQYANISTSSPQDFFNTATLLVNIKDMTNSFQVLRVVLRNQGTAVKSVDILIPTFLANPAKYNADPRHPVTLQSLHPLQDKLGQSWTEPNYFEFARAFCF